MLELTMLPRALQSEILAPRQVREDVDHYAHEIHTVECRVARGTTTEATLLEMAGAGTCSSCFDSRGNDLRDALYVLSIISAGSRRHFKVKNDDLISLASTLEHLTRQGSELTALFPQARAAIELRREQHREWLRTNGTEALRRFATALVVHGKSVGWSAKVNRTITFFCEGEEVPPEVDQFAGPEESTPVLVAELNAVHAQRAQEALSSGWIAVEVAEKLPRAIGPTGRTSDAMTALVTSPRSLVIPRDLAPVVEEFFDLDVGLHDCQEIGLEEVGILDTLRCLLADGTALPEALTIARAL